MAQSKQKNIEAIYPLSPMQQGMLFHSIYEPQSGTYFEQFSCRLHGDFDHDAFSRAWHDVVRRHSVLRTAFVYKKLDKMLQVVHRDVELPITILNWSELPQQEQDIKIKQFLIDDRQKGFNLSKAPLLRIHLFRLKEDLWQVVWSYHHLILDGWSNPILLKELFFLYEANIKGVNPPLPPARPFKEYILWLQKQDKERATAYWKDLLWDISAPTPFNVDKLPNPHKPTDLNSKQNLRISSEDTDLIKKMARGRNLTINSVVQGAWSLLLHHYSREKNIVFGATVSGRPAQIPDIQNMVGLFINTLPMRVRIDPAQKTNAFLRDIQKQGLILREYEFSALAEVQKQSGVQAGPLFESILVFENYPVEEEMKRQKLSLKLSDVDVHEQTNFPLTLLVGADREILIDASYQPARFTEAVITDMLGHLRNLLLSMGRNPDLPVGQHRILDREQEKSLLKLSKGPKQNYGASAFITARFEQQVRTTPAQTAVIFEKQKLSYAGFNEAVNRLAHVLIAKGIGPDCRVAVFMERSIEMTLSLYAILKAGACYVPIDPTNPIDRVRYMLDDSQPALILTQSKFKNAAALQNTMHLPVSMDDLSNGNANNPGLPIHPDQAAYMIYTSGSTGKPKGVIISHKAIANRLQWMQDTFSLNAADRVLQKTPYTFDVSVWEFFWPLMYGATLIMAKPEGHKDTTYLIKTIREQNVTVLHFVPPMLRAFLESWEVEKCSSLKHVICSGEALPFDLKERFYKKLNARLHNLYGPTEAAVDVTWYSCPKDSPYRLLPIGMPVANTSIYILDEFFQPVPIGVPGELFIGGVQLARGYYERPSLTAEKFVPDPFIGQPGARMYRSGDLTRRLADGNIDYLSRIDFQLKIRGFRIELGEIEYQLTQLNTIREAMVSAYEPQTGNKQLVAYVVPAGNTDALDIHEIRDALAVYLPDYMLPSFIVPMKTFPLTANGKIDRKALPEPNPITTDNDISSEPVSDIEKQVHDIWRDILSIDKIGIHTDFFQLGGHSILATRLVTRFRQTFHVEVPLSAIFEAPTIARQALLIEMEQAMGQRSSLPELKTVSRSGPLPVSLPQQRLWFIDQFNPGSTAYNINLALIISGPLNTGLLEKSIEKVIERHEALRTRFINQDGSPYQVILETPVFKLEMDDAAGKSGPEKSIIAQTTKEMALTVFDLQKLPLLRMKIVRLDKERFLLSGVIHHIISDGLSMALFIKETLGYYRSLSLKEPYAPPELPFQYADYAAWQREWLSGDILQQHIDYWKNHIGMQPPVLEMPLDFPRPAVQTFNGQKYDFELNGDLTQRLKKFTQQQGMTLFMMLMTVWQVLLHRYSRQQTILIGFPVAGRLLEDANKLIGFFVNTLVIKGQYKPETTFRESLSQIRQNVLNAHAHQSLPFEQLVELLQPDRDLAHPPLFQAAFILQNEQEAQTGLDDLYFEEVVPESVVSKVDLSLYVREQRGNIDLSLEYNRDLFRASTIERMVKHFTHLLTSAIERPSEKVDRLPLTTEDEMRQMLHSSVSRPADILEHKNVVDAFNFQVGRMGERDALVMGSRHINYAELGRLSDNAAAHLMGSGVARDDIIGICMSRSPEMIIAMLAILKAGAAYLPLDPSYPMERLRYMANDSGTKYILTNRETQSVAKEVFPPGITLKTIESLSGSTTKNSNKLPLIDEQQLAYVIYTSGSTGKPKGTLLQHAGLVNLAHEQQKAFHINEKSRILQFASLSFDAATWEIFMALLNGAILHLIDSETQASPAKLQDVLVQEKITTLTLPPSVLALFDDRPMAQLQTIITAGEKCPRALVRRFQPGRQMINAYGPTETTVCACLYECNASETSDPAIGFPLGGFDLYVMDSQMQPLPVGIPGELCIGGKGLARGYINRSELTQEKFVPYPCDRPTSRLYKSGDLVKRREDGALEFLGRIDQQVKFRGFRIELGEIQNAFLEIEGINDAYVMVREDIPGDQRLSAYLVGSSAKGIPFIKKQLAGHLPNYMLPSSIIFLDELPLTVNGKVDSKKLPVPEAGRSQISTEFVAPRDEMEKNIALIVQDLLNLDRVGIYDDFFDLGGHSLLATKFVSRIREQFQLEVPLRVLFENPSIAGIVQALSGPDARAIDADEPILEARDRSQEDDDEELLAAMDDLSAEDLNALLNENDGDDNDDE